MAPSISDNSPSFLQRLGMNVVVAVFAHPVNYVKVLIQIGHEPLPPVPTKTWLGKEVMRYPDFIQYANHIRRTDGWLGLYRGLGPRLAHHLVSSAVTNAVVSRFSQKESGPKASEESSDINDDEKQLELKEYLKETCVLTVGKTIGVIASYPLHLIGVRMMAQFVGRETIYNNVFSSIKEIYQEEGILGFFSGLVASLIGELVSFWTFQAMSYCIEIFVLDNETIRATNICQYTRVVSQIGSGMTTYPFMLVANVMAVNTSRLAAASPPNMPIYSNWIDCWRSLSKQGLLRRGDSIFVRKVPTSVALQ